MITTWQVLSESTETFTPILERLWEIAKEFVLYFIFISIWILWVILIRNAVKMILNYLKEKTEAVYWRNETRRFKKIINRNIDKL